MCLLCQKGISAVYFASKIVTTPPTYSCILHISVNYCEEAKYHHIATVLILRSYIEGYSTVFLNKILIATMANEILDQVRDVAEGQIVSD
jgi:hypothetical protein